MPAKKHSHATRKPLKRITDQPPPIAPRIIPSGPNLTYMSGQWKRRPGNTLYDTPMRNVRAAPNVELDPQLRRDVPDVESAEGQLGIGS